MRMRSQASGERVVGGVRVRRRFAYVGTGGRVRMFLDPAAGPYAGNAEIVGLCDISLVRARFHQERLRQRFGYPAVPVFAAAEFGRMLAETRPDVVVVCTIDREHDRYIIAALEAGCDVVTEKPMTVTAPKCAAVLEAVRASGRTLRVAFNYRWAAGAAKVREVLAGGAIGAVRQVTMEYLLNTFHGADYFRRWHADRRDSGGLLVHKSTHHFDLINWWIDAIPETVFAQGALSFYGRANAEKRGDAALARYPRYLDSGARGDPFAYDYTTSAVHDSGYERGLYLGAAEEETGYVRDRNVFRDDITIEDAMNVLVRYRTGVLLNYSLNAFSPYEGFRVAFTGDRGRIEYQEWHGAHIVGDDPNGHPPAPGIMPALRVYPHFKAPYDVAIEHLDGPHGGGDRLLQEHLYSAGAVADPLRRAAGHEQGAASILVGIAANASIATGAPIAISNLVPLKPDAMHLSDLI